MTISRDFIKGRAARIMPDRQTVTVTPYSGGTAGTPYTVENAERPDIRAADAELFTASGFSIQVDSFQVILNEADLGGNEPRPNDRITTDDGTVSRIVSIQHELLRTRFKCLCYPHKG